MKFIDKQVGVKMRRRRHYLGMSQEDLASRVGVKYQQIQKYETGHNRVSASRLWEIARALKVTIAYFFPEEDTDIQAAGLPNDLEDEAREFVQHFQTLSVEQRQALLGFVRTMRTK